MRKEGQTEEYRRRLRERHMLESVCLSAAVLMIVLCGMFFFQGQNSTRMLKGIVLLGGMMNLGLFVRGILMRQWGEAVFAFLAFAICAGVLVYVQWF